MPFSLREAAQHAGVSKSTILRAIRSGRLSAARTEDAGYAIDPAELARVYRPQRAAGQAAERSAGQDATGATVQDNAIDNAGLRAEVEGLRQLLAQMRDQLADVKDDRDGWRKQAEAAQRLLAASTPSAGSELRRSWWRRLAG